SMTGTCSNCYGFSDDLVKLSEGELVCRKCMLGVAAGYSPADAELSDDEVFYSGNENLTLEFDDDGEALWPGDHVRVNGETVATIIEVAGKRFLHGFPNDQIVDSIELISDDRDEWPEEVD
ncbi:MAG: hypothetical protein ABI999_11470, partial [Acidobacteriota bacterium]